MMATWDDGIFRVLELTTREKTVTVKISGLRDETTEVREIMIPLETLQEMVSAQG
jgi:hypothetical protein